MPDITMCSGKNCELQDRCYRHTAEPNPMRQSYFVESPVQWTTGEWESVQVCDYFWSNTGK